MDDCRLVTFQEMPELDDLSGSVTTPAWPEFMMHDNVAEQGWGAMITAFPEFQFGLFDPQGKLAAIGNSIPFYWDAPLSQLPSEGWDFVLEQGLRDHQAGRKANMLPAISIAIHPDWRGQQISPRLVNGMRQIATQHGLKGLVAPVRPSLKSQYPLIPMQQYAYWQREDGSPFDPWLRVHWRLGGRILHIAERAMRFEAPVADWEAWTGLRFPGTGDYLIPGALTPVHIDLESDRGLYIEPNVWMEHQLPDQETDTPAPPSP
jgi:GNAT superfamily N-acetyltransferase